jgi:Na+-transporting NADH:ubiquinone oxidoreductase subunit NqrF
LHNSARTDRGIVTVFIFISVFVVICGKKKLIKSNYIQLRIQANDTLTTIANCFREGVDLFERRGTFGEVSLLLIFELFDLKSN